MESFTVQVPHCGPGTVLEVETPEGSMLNIPVPEGALHADIIHLARRQRAGSHEWRCTGISRQTQTMPVFPSAPSRVPRRRAEDLEADLAREDTVVVLLQTTKGPLLLRVVPRWAPKGAQRLLQMVDSSFFREVAVYRAVPGTLVQFGIVQDPSRQTRYPRIEDDVPMGVPAKAGTVLFASSGLRSRQTTLSILLKEQPGLGDQPWETPVGQVLPRSLPILERLCHPYGDLPQCGGSGPDPLLLQELGQEYLAAHFPLCEQVLAAARVFRELAGGWLECLDSAGRFFYSLETGEVCEQLPFSPRGSSQTPPTTLQERARLVQEEAAPFECTTRDEELQVLRRQLRLVAALEEVSSTGQMSMRHTVVEEKSPSAASQRPSRVLQLGVWQVSEDSQGELFIHLLSGLATRVAPPELLVHFGKRLQEERQLQREAHLQVRR